MNKILKSFVIRNFFIFIFKKLRKILKFIFKLRNINFSLDNNKFEKMLDTTTFDNLKSLEEKQGFPEKLCFA